MRALRFSLTISNYLLGRGLDAITDAAFVGKLSGLRLVDGEPPVLPGPRWARLEVLAAGVCGTDLSTLAYETSPVMEPLASFPAVMGHEIVARVLEVGEAVEGLGEGDLVVVDPMISCKVRGFDGDNLCPSCAMGRPSTCARAAAPGGPRFEGRSMAPGLSIGFHRDLFGGWSEEMVAHQSQLHQVDLMYSPLQAVLIEPLSVAVHAVLGVRDALEAPEGPVLVIGSGPVALATIWALRAMGYDGELLAQVKRPGESELALSLGASAVAKPGVEARGALLRTGARAIKPMIGDEVFHGGGYGVIFDAVGHAASLEQSLRFAGARGTVVLLGCAGELSRLDLSFLWSRELQVRGFVGYGRERWEGEELHTFELTQRLMGQTRKVLDSLVTHQYGLDEYREALLAARDRRHSGAMKVVFRPSDDRS